MTKMGPEYCDKCATELEEGQIGLCGDCQPVECVLCDSVATQTVAGTPYCETHGNEFRAYLRDQIIGGAQ